ncbi:MAG: hypothetical protein QXU69_05290 [Thermofilaceae archaeon]
MEDPRKVISDAKKVCDFLDSQEKAAEELRSSSVRSVEEARNTVEDWINELRKELEKVRNSQLSFSVRRQLEESLKRRISTARSLLDDLEELELSLSGWSVRCPVGGSEEVPVTLKNNVPLPCNVALEVDPGSNLDAELSKSRLRLEPYSVSEVGVRVRPRKEGRHTVKLRANAKWLDVERKFESNIVVEAVPLKPELKIRPRLAGEAVEGEDVLVEVEVENAGEATAEVVLKNPFDGERRVRLEPGEKEVVPFVGKLGPGRRVLLLEATCVDELGNVHSLPVQRLEVEVKPKPEEKHRPERKEVPAPAPGGPLVKPDERERSAGPPLDVGGLLDALGKHSLAFMVGMLAGRLAPERKKWEKPVYVLDVPYVKREGATVILEDPAGVVVEDRGSSVLVRRARLSEILNSISRDAARNLIGNFKALVEAAISSWRPPLREEIELLGVRSKDLTERRVAELVEEVRRRGQKVDREEVEEVLPTVFIAEYSFGQKGVVRAKPRLKVYAGAYARLDKLYFHGVDHGPLNLEEALEGLELEEEFKKVEEHCRIFLLASPTGWSPNAVEQARRIRGATQLVLMDLKKGEAFYNEADEAVRSLVEHLGFGVPPVLATKAPLEELDVALLSGSIDEATYRARLERLLAAE